MHRKGFFTELNAKVRIELPMRHVARVTVETADLDLIAYASPFDPPPLRIFARSGTVTLPAGWREKAVEVHAPPGAMVYK